jgi:hypothetical protein
MEDNQSIPEAVAPTAPIPPQEEEKPKRSAGIYIVIGAIVLLVLIGAAVYILLRADLDTTSKLRDIFIIFMALEFLVVGLALVVLMVQLATLINLLQNEIKPILYSTNETVSTLRGTAVFLSENLTEPVIRLNQYLAGFKRAIDLLRITRR